MERNIFSTMCFKDWNISLESKNKIQRRGLWK